MQLIKHCVVVATVAAIGAQQVHAQDGWTLLRSLPSGTSFYYHKASVKKEKGVGYITMLINQEPTQFNNVVYQSQVSREEVDCKKATYASLQSQLFSGKFAGGDLLLVTQPSISSQIIFPNSWMEDMYKVVCSGGR